MSSYLMFATYYFCSKYSVIAAIFFVSDCKDLKFAQSA